MWWLSMYSFHLLHMLTCRWSASNCWFTHRVIKEQMISIQQNIAYMTTYPTRNEVNHGTQPYSSISSTVWMEYPYERGSRYPTSVGFQHLFHVTNWPRRSILQLAPASKHEHRGNPSTYIYSDGPLRSDSLSFPIGLQLIESLRTRFPRHSV